MPTPLRLGDRVLELASILAPEVTQMVIVGGTAEWIAGRIRRMPRDLDIVVTMDGYGSLTTALSSMAIRVPRLMRRGYLDSPAALVTPWGPLDVFIRAQLPASVVVPFKGRALRLSQFRVRVV